MAASDFLSVDVSAICSDLAGEVNKTYQHLPWALKHEAVARLKRQVHELSQTVAKAKDSQSVARTEKYLADSLALVHECVPLIDLCLRKNLLSPELQARWTRQLSQINRVLGAWQKATSHKG